MTIVFTSIDGSFICLLMYVDDMLIVSKAMVDQ